MFIAEIRKYCAPRGAGLLISPIRGYPFTLALAGKIVWLGLIALVSKLYDEVLDCLAPASRPHRSVLP